MSYDGILKAVLELLPDTRPLRGANERIAEYSINAAPLRKRSVYNANVALHEAVIAVERARFILTQEIARLEPK